LAGAIVDAGREVDKALADYKITKIESDHGELVALVETAKGYLLTVGSKGIPELNYVDCLRIFRVLRMMFPAIEDKAK